MASSRRRVLKQAALIGAGVLAPRSALASRRVQVAVIGAGLAGLAAAWRLRKQGLDVAVLEAGEVVGGRMVTAPFGDHRIDWGVKFLARNYAVMMPLITELGLAGAMRPLSPWCAVVHEGRPRRIHWGRPASFVESGLLSLPGAIAAQTGFARAWREVRRLPMDRFTGWVAIDEQNADTWSREQLGDEVTRAVLAPSITGIYFVELPLLSRSQLCYSRALQLRRGGFLMLEGGLGALPAALARGIDVRLECPVERVVVAEDGVEIHSEQGTWRADRVVLATPADIAARLLGDEAPSMGAALDIRYASSVEVAIACDRDWQKQPGLRRVYGLVVPAHERDCIASVEFGSAKGRAEDSRELLQVMTTHEATTALGTATDTVVVERVLRELDRWLPGVTASAVDAEVRRWRHALPIMGPGRAQAIATYRAEATGRVILAGDYLGFPASEGALESGLWAADRLLEGVAPTSIGRRRP
jgi:oxygen-dependent protoporphyrinogen oxidase